ncbi:hypothetical protein FBZ89_11398 [Nitrospirillum amazonense]|uniref:Lipoprotein n=1 Tax=Nitrospirillum amazonense TaxID=28077 RepID=A0A560F511_9PROT|nr:hypothetical protein [Nitrospirillum amazonense]TWB16688.1 hypothetical protein FBZ89_11398 [Nitrospirillum amazonense]
MKRSHHITLAALAAATTLSLSGCDSKHNQDCKANQSQQADCRSGGGGGHGGGSYVYRLQVQRR